MGIICKPNLKVEDIEIEINEEDKEGADKFLEVIGPKMPVVKINDYVLTTGELQSFNLDISINSIPLFDLTINDDSFNVRRNLQKEKIDTIIVFIGYKDWYLKFNGILIDIDSNNGSSKLNITGRFFNKKLYESIQKSYNKKTITDILKDICTLTDMGLFTVENDLLNKSYDNILNTNKKHIDYFDYVIKNYTNNIWSVDTHGFFHVANIESLRKQPLDKFSIFNGKKQEEKDMVLTTDRYYIHENDETIPIEKLIIDKFTVNSNIGFYHINSNNKYTVEDNKESKELKVNPDNNFIGISDNSENTFSEFTKSFFPFYDDIINKDIASKIISISMKDVIYELSPFSIVNLELYVPRNIKIDGEMTENEEPYQILDKENSGKKIVIGFSLNFSNKNTGTTIYQKIKLI